MRSSPQRHWARAPRHATVFGLFLFATGCAAFKQVKPYAIERAPTFSPSALVERGVVIGTMACSRPERLARETSSADLASSLRERLLEAHPGMTVLTPDSVERALGADAYRGWAQIFQDSGQVGVERFPEIAAGLQGSARFLLVARVQEDEITRDHGDHEVSRDGRWVDEGEEYDTARTTKMLFRLYDLGTSSMEWSGKFETTKVVTNVEDEDDSRLGRVIAVLDFVFAEESGADTRYPDPVSIETQTGLIFEEFVATMFDAE